MSIQPPSTPFRRSLSAKTIKLKARSARLLVLLALMTLTVTALAATVSSSSLRQFIFGAAASGSGNHVATSKAALTNPLLNAALFTSSGSTMTVERRGHTATRLPDGRVLIAGGENTSGVLNQCEIYDPATGNFTVAGNMSSARADHSATLMSDGRVLIAGGRDAVGATKTTEIFDPATGAFAGGANMSVARAGHSATLFADGTVLIAGGDADGSAEIFDPSTGSFSAIAANLTAARSMHSAALLADGRVLLVGGRTRTGDTLSSGEIFNPADSSISDAGSMTDARVRPLLRVLFDGKVQIIGGNDHQSLEIYDPAAGMFGGHAHVPPDGDLHPTLINEIMSSPSCAALLTGGQTITELTGNQALAAGGVDSNGNATNASTIYGSSPASVTSDKLDYPPGTPIIITGRGFQPNEIVDLTFHEDPHVDTNELHVFTVQADANGSFTFDQYAPEEADLGIMYILGAKGESSGWTAQTAFTDARNWVLTFAGSGSGTVKVTPNTGTVNAPVSCGGTGVDAASQTVSSTCTPNISTSANGATVTFLATAAGGSTFAGWSGQADLTPASGAGSCTGTNNPCSVVIGPSGTLTATFSGGTTDVTVTKTADAATISAGSTAGYTITAVNAASGTAATNVTLTDTLPGTGITWTMSPSVPGCSITGGNSLSCTFATLASGASQAVHVIGTTTSANCGTLNNTATISSSNDSNTGNNSSGAVAIVVQCPDVRVQKAANPVGPVSAGDTIGFDVTLSNIGTGNATGLTFTDSLPAGLTWTINPASTGWSISGSSLLYSPTTLAAGASTTVHVQATTSSTDCGLVSNTASASATNEAAGATGNNSATANVTVQCPDISVTKVVDAATVSAGDQIGYTITVSNASAAGTGTAAGVSLSDTLPTNSGTSWSKDGADAASCTISAGALSCTFGSLAPGASKVVHIFSPTTSATCGPVSNTATTSATNEAAAQQGNNSSGAVVITVNCPDVKVTKVANPVGPVSAGDDIGFDATLSNIGAGNAAGVSFTDTLPSGLTWTINPSSAGWSISSGALVYTPTTLAAGFSTSVHVQATTSSANCGPVANTASASATNEKASDNGNNSANASVTVNCPDVKVTKVANPVGPVSAGDDIGFDVTLSNIGAGNAAGVSFTDTLPSGLTWTINPSSAGWSISSGALVYTPTTLAAGFSTSVHVQATTSSANCGPVANTASASATNEKASDNANNSANASVTVNCPDVKVTKTANPVGPVSAGDDIGFDVTLSNIGTGNAVGVSFTDTLPAGSTWTIDPASTGWSIVSGNLVYSPTTLAAGASSMVHVKATTSSANCGPVSNTASASATNEKASDNGNNTANASVTVQCPDISTTKVADASTVNAGDQIGYTITVSNSSAAGTGTARGVTLADTLPTNGGTNWSKDGTDAGSCTFNSGVLNCSFGDLAPGATKTVHIYSPTSSETCGTVANSATASATNEASTALANNSAGPINITVQCPDISTTKVADASTVNAGDQIGYTITVSNSSAAGTGTARGVTLADTLPTNGGTNWSKDGANAADCTIASGALTCNFGDLAAGASKTVHIYSPTSSQTCGTVANSATASATNEASTALANNSAGPINIMVQCPDISTTKVADASTVNAGDQIGYTITVSNSSAAGTGTARGVTLADTLPTNGGTNWSKDGANAADCTIASGALTCNFGDLAAGASKTVHIYSPTSSQTCGTVANSATASATNEASTALANNSAGPINITVNCPDIKVTKAANPIGPVSAGDEIGFDVTLANIGAGNATGVTFTDALPSGLTWTIDPPSTGWSIVSGNLVYTPTTLAAGASSMVHVKATTSSANCGPVSNTASASASNEAASANANNTANASVTVNCPDVEVLKTANPAGPVSAGDDIGFDVKLSNIGAGNATGVTFTDALPSGLTWTIDPPSAGWSIVSGNLVYTPTTLAAGFSTTVHVKATTSSANCGAVSNTASASAGNEAASANANNTANASVTVQCPDVAATKVADAGTVSAGDPIGYLITVSNGGAGMAKGVALTDLLPTNGGLNWSVDGGTAGGSCTITTGTLNCNIGNLASGASVTVHIASPTTSASCGTVSNTANASATNEAASANGNDSSGAVNIAVQCPDVAATKVADAGTVSAGDPIGYLITVSNGGAGMAKGVALTDLLPTNGGLNWSVDGGTAGGSCTITTGTLNCNIGNLASGASVTVHIASPTTSASCGTVSNTANASATNEAASANGNDSSGAVNIAVQCPDVAATKVADAGTVSAGDPIGYLITVSNGGAGMAKGVALTDLLPTNGGLNWSVDGGTAGGSCTITTGTLNCNIGNLASGASVTVHIASPTTSASCGTVSNTANASATNEAASANGNDSSGAVNIAVQCPDVAATKVADAGTVSAGDPIGYLITVSNGGAGMAKGVALTDLLPTNGGLNWSVDGGTAGGSCTITTGTLNCNIGNLASGASVTVHIASPTTSASCGTVSNTANASATNEAASANGNDSSGAVNIAVQCPDVAATKVADAGTVSAGDPIGYLITVSNGGAGMAKGVALTDLLPTNGGLNWSVDGGTAGGSCTITTGTLNCNIGNLASGASVTVHIASPTTSASCGTVSNTANASATNEAASANGNDSSGAVNIAVQCPDLTVSKTKDASPVSSGDTIGFTIVVSNAGPGTARSVTLSDTLPTNAGTSWSVGGADGAACSISSGVLNCSFGDLGVASKTVHISSPTTSATCGTVSNSATASATNEANTANNTGSDSIDVQCPELTVVKTKDASPVSSGDPIGFTIVVNNGGPGTARSVTLTDTLPTNAGTNWTVGGADGGACSISLGVLNCSFGDVSNGASKTVHISSPTTSATCGTVSNSATASATNEANTANNTGSDSITVNCPDLTVSKTPDAASVSSNDDIGFTITVNNGGAGTASNVTLTDTLPTNTGLSWSINGGADAAQCSISSGTLSCNYGTVTAGGSKTVHIKSPTTPDTCGTVSNSASASASNEANTSNNSGSGSIAVNCPDVVTTKVPDATPVNGGSPIGFQITVSNTGAGTAKGVILTDTLPTNPGLNWTIDPLNTDPTCSITSGVLNCTFGDVASGGSKKVHITSPTTTATCGPVMNTATASATNEATSANGNNSATATITMNDVTAPVINLNPNAVTTLWSPNHKYVTFKVTDLVTSVTDNCNTTISLGSVRITKVTSDEPENINSGDGNTFKDMVIANDCKSVDLRAERDGSKNGRVYTITFKVTDASGNVGTATAIVTVPHSQGPKGTAIDDGPVYTVTNTLCP